MPNDYSLTVTDASGCQNSDTVSIAYNPYPVLDLGNDTTFCLGDESVLNIQQSTIGADYLWQNGSNSATFVVREPGDTYIASVTLDDCIKMDTVNIDYQPCNCTVAVPNAFTPNGDNRNDNFQVLYDSNCIFSTFNFQIFNRWGKLVFSTQDINTTWDGYVNGTLQAEDSYLYVVEYELSPQFNQPKQIEKGAFLLIR
jgi:gliding motility-associated-like protein